MTKRLSRFWNPRCGAAAVVVVGLWAAAAAGFAQTTRAIQVVADDEKRSSIHEVDGYAYLSEDMTLSETRAAALVNAKRQAVEMARTHIKSKTEVENFVIKSDQIEGTAEGAVTVLEQKDLGIEDNTRYHVWIRAEVQYALNPEAPDAGEAVMDPDAPLTVKVWTSKKNYMAGEQMEIFIEGNKDFFGRIVDITAGGEIIQLLPNDFRKDNFFRAGKRYKIPDTDDRFNLTVSPPFGEDQIIVYASESPLGDVDDMKSVGGGLKMYTGNQKGFAAKTRGIMVTGADAAPGAGADFFEATWKVSTSQ